MPNSILLIQTRLWINHRDDDNNNNNKGSIKRISNNNNNYSFENIFDESLYFFYGRNFIYLISK